jgi:hypothetical protein
LSATKNLGLVAQGASMQTKNFAPDEQLEFVFGPHILRVRELVQIDQPKPPLAD